jgi:tetratricopeptide (TPR) repeat protein
MDTRMGHVEKRREPDTPEAWFNRGVTHIGEGDYPAAEECFSRAVALAPHSRESMLNLGYVLGEQGRSEEARRCYESVLAVFPACAEARYNRAAHLLRSGDFRAGFADYEARFAAMKSVDQRVYSQPRWDGSPLLGRSILVYCEQGLGDALQFSRYVPLLAEQGAKVILEVQRPLISLLASVKGVERIVAKSETPPSADFHIPLLSLPHIFGTTLESVPASVPYITPPETLVAAWRKQTGAEPGILRVGLAWAGKERPYPNRSCPPEYLAPLFAVNGIRFYSLQIGERDRLPLPPELAEQVIDLTAGLENFADAALIVNLDLVITIDTAVAHLAGALGKPVWVLLPAVADWRWLEGRDDSPWYPTMRLFRQSRQGDWACVAGQVARALHERVAGVSAGTAYHEMHESLFATAMELLEQKAFAAAIFQFRKLLAMIPDDPAVWFNLGQAYIGKENYTDAELCFLKAIEINPDSTGSWLALGELYLQQSKFPDAEKCLRKAHQLVPASFKILLLLGTALIPQEKTSDAFDCCRKVIAIKPECVEAFYNMGYLQLRSGNYLEGFKNFEARLEMKSLNSDGRRYLQPRWDGSLLHGRSILIFGEQGLGDVIQFCRYVPLVARQSGKVVLEVDAPYVPFFESSFKGMAQVIPKSETPPSTDVYIQSFSLPHIFHTTLDTIPNTIPYLVVDPVKSAKWRARLAEDTAYRVGLVWRGSPRNPMDKERSCTLAALSPLAGVRDVSFYSLQFGATEEAKSPPQGMRFTDPGPLFENLTETLTDTAALIANLDLIICVDTGVAHLAGAIGKPVWLLLASTPDWRWLVGCEDSPWYPTMRLFRQDQRGDWGGVIDRVGIALDSLVKERAR